MKRTHLLALLLILPTPAWAQHDPGRNATRLLAKGEVDEAIKLVAKPPKRMNSPISEAEREFVLIMAACKQGNVDAAFKHAQQAVKNGLPIERLQAGPRDVLAPLFANKAFETWLKTKQLQLLHGPLLGSLTDTAASFWVRTAGEADIKIVAHALDENTVVGKPISGKSRTSAGNDYTTTVRVSGLKPMTNYRYQVSVDQQPAGSPAEFQTYPKKNTGDRFSIAFGGGAGFTPQYERMWTTIGSHAPDALLLLGDNVYIDDPTHPLSQQYCYYRRQSQPEWKSLVATTSVFTIYDDHDFGTNDCIPGPEIESPNWKRPVWEVFSQNWNNPSYGGGSKQPGCWYDFQIGDVQFIMLDGRYYRDLAGGSMLGPIQKKWLFETLKSSKGKFKVLASPVPWSPGVKGGSKDTWDGFPDEREEIFSFIERKKIEGVLLMAADRHRTDLRKITRPKGYDLYEVMSSKLTNVHTHSLLENAKGSEWIMGYNKKCSFGLLEFDTTREDPQVNFKIINIDNQKIDSRTLNLSQLSAPNSKNNE